MRELHESHNDILAKGEMTAGCQPDFGNRIWLGSLAIICVTLLAYSSVFSAGFIWDDDFYVINNHYLRSFEGLSSIWFEPGATPQYYPMVFTLFWAQFQLWGLNPSGYHLVNILLHIANALLLWLCLQRIKVPAAFWVAALFALHPVQVESVAWITELKNVLSLFFYLLSLYTYLSYAGADGAPTGSKKWWCYAASLFFFLLALFSKTVSGSLPAAILLIRWWQHGSVKRREVAALVPFFVLAILLGGQTAQLEVSHVLAKGAEWDFSAIDRLLIAGRAAWFYFGKLLWPHPLIFNYPRWTIDAGAWWQYLFPVSLCVVLYILWHLRQRLGRGPLAAVLFFVGTLFPALGFFNVYPMRFSFVADHFQYIAGIGAIIMFCAASCLLMDKLLPGLKNVRTIFFSAVLLTLSLLTWQQGNAYRSNLTLFNDTIDKNPASWFGYSNRAVWYMQSGKEDLAMSDLEMSLAIKPDEADALQTRGVIHLKNKKLDRAFADFDLSIAIRPWRSDYILNRSSAYKYVGRLDEALVDADRVIAMEPDDARNFLHRAGIYSMLEEYEKVLGDLNRALMLAPEDFQIYANRGLIYYRQGLLSKAISDFDVALKLRPGSAETYYNRGLAHAASGSVDKSQSDLVRARELGYQLDDIEIKRILSATGNKK